MLTTPSCLYLRLQYLSLNAQSEYKIKSDMLIYITYNLACIFSIFPLLLPY